jgi:hypothetical protein
VPLLPDGYINLSSSTFETRTYTPDSTAFDNSTQLTTVKMAKKLTEVSSDSSLSPVADDLIAQVETGTAVAPAPKGKKRKAATKSTKPRTKKATPTEPKDEEVAANDDEDSAPRNRRGKPPAKKLKLEEAVAVEEGVEVKAELKVTKKKAIKKKVDLTPISERTIGCKSLIGAHVSTSGG